MATKDEKKLEALIADFEKGNPAAAKNFRDLVNDTPTLKANLLDAIHKGNLDKIGPLPAGLPAGVLGGYDPTTKSMVLPVGILDLIDKDAQLSNTMRMVVTHESAHAVNKQSIEKADKAFDASLEKIAKGPSPHDYTNVIKTHNASERLREATDQIGGFNALAAHVRKQNPSAKPGELYEKLYHSSDQMEQYFDVSGTPPKQTFAPKAGLTVDKEGHIAPTKANVEAMAKHFYDANGYQQIYGVRALQRAVDVEGAAQSAAAAKDPKYTPPEVRVNLKELGLDGKVAFPPGSGITDTSPKPAAPKAPVSPIEGAAPRAAEPALYLQSVSALEKLGGDTAALGNREQFNAVAAAMAVKAQHDGLDRVDAVLASRDGKGLIAVQGDPSTPQAKTSYLDKAAAAEQPLEQNLAQLQREQPQAAVAQPVPQASAPTR